MIETSKSDQSGQFEVVMNRGPKVVHQDQHHGRTMGPRPTRVLDR